MTVQPTQFPTQIQRAIGQVRLRTKLDAAAKTGLDTLYQRGSSKTVFPKPTHDNLEAVLVNTAGGVTGGDQFNVSVHAATGTRVNVTTQAAERIYSTSTGEDGRIDTKLTVEDGAHLGWLPQETILFDTSRLRRTLTVDVAPTARFLMVEPLVFGRTASGEQLRNCCLRDSVSISDNGAPLYRDRVQLSGDISKPISRPAVAAGATAMASVVLIDRNAARHLQAMRGLLPHMAGASLLNDRTLVIRLLSADSYDLRCQLLPILTQLTHNALPKNWRL